MSVCRTVTKYHWIVRNASLRAAFATTTSTTSPKTSHSHATSKVVGSAKQALSDCIFPGASINCGGFGLGGVPETLLNELAKTDKASDLTIASLTAGIDGFGLGKLFEAGKVKRMIASYVGENIFFAEMYFGGKIEVELTPQGTIAARMRSAGIGIPAVDYADYSSLRIFIAFSLTLAHFTLTLAFYTPAGAEIASLPRETRFFHGKEFVMEEALPADIAIVKAWKADTRGNLIFRGTSRNSNPDCAMSGKVCIAEAEEIVDAGELKPDEIHLAGVYVDKLILAVDNEKRIERLKLSSTDKLPTISSGRARMVKRAAKEFKDGMYVNLGIGIPTMASNYVRSGLHIELQAENGLLGLGPYPSTEEDADSDFINAGKETITPIKGASSFSSSDSFGMIRGGHIDLTILGGLQVSQNGDLANWIIPGHICKGMGGAMDLISAPNVKVVVTLDHIAKDGSPKILSECSLPLTGKRVVDRIITDLCVFDVDKNGDGGLVLVEIAAGLSIDDLRERTGCDFKVASDPLPLMLEGIEKEP
eukprot:scaffold1908_cov192-Chaetoceros_neogracile.AAC.4